MCVCVCVGEGGGGGERVSSLLLRLMLLPFSPSMPSYLARIAHEVVRKVARSARCGFLDRDGRGKRWRGLRAELDRDGKVSARRGAHCESDGSERPVRDRLEAFERAEGDRCRLQRDVQLGTRWAKVRAKEALRGA